MGDILLWTMCFTLLLLIWVVSNIADRLITIERLVYRFFLTKNITVSVSEEQNDR